MPPRITPWVRTKSLNKKSDGCYICGRKRFKKYGTTRHHIRRGLQPLVVYLCWKHHRIIHAVSLDKFPLHDLRMVLAVADVYDLYKVEEKGMVRKKIIMEIERRESQNT